MFERAEVRRGARAVSFAVAAVAHGLLLLAAILLVRKQLPEEGKEREPLRIVVPQTPWKGPPGNQGAPPRHETSEPRHRPRPPKPVDVERLKPPPVPEPKPLPDVGEDAPVEEQSTGPGVMDGPRGGGEAGSGPEIGGCVGAVCGSVAPPLPTEVIDFRQQGVVRPTPLCDPPAPTMPEQARIMGITGAVVMRYVVEPDGSVSRIQLRNRDAAPVLVDAVRGWLERCRFTPGMARGKPAPIQIEKPLVFKLH